jgi:hypothetical protein
LGLRIGIQERQSLHSLPNIVTTIQVRMMLSVGHVVRMSEMKNAYSYCEEILEKQIQMRI